MNRSTYMLLTLAAGIFFFQCGQTKNREYPILVRANSPEDSIPHRSYEEIKHSISGKRKEFAGHLSELDDSMQKAICDFWVNAIGNELFYQWQDTPWDFNGTSTQPRQGTIACGYFVTTILRDMDLPVNRVKLSTCPSSVMMKSLVPHQRLNNLSFLDYPSFNEKLSGLGRGVYIIGLDFHTGFIVNDGKENWFIHSNYIGRKGVTRETVLNSAALKASRTRWLVSLTGDPDFIKWWLKNSG